MCNVPTCIASFDAIGMREACAQGDDGVLGVSMRGDEAENQEESDDDHHEEREEGAVGVGVVVRPNLVRCRFLLKTTKS